MQVSDSKVVLFHYTLTNAKGELLDTSEGNNPLGYLHGRGHIISGLERALEGRSAGDKINVTLSPDEAYGERDEELVQRVQRSAFQGVDSIEPGMQFQARYPEGPQTVTVTKVDGDEVTIDANHPLAGETLTFDVEIAEVREPTAEELQHGHVHSHDGHH